MKKIFHFFSLSERWGLALALLAALTIVPASAFAITIFDAAGVIGIYRRYF